MNFSKAESKTGFGDTRIIMFLSVVTSSINAIYMTNKIIGSILVFIELMTLLFFLVQRKYELFLCYYAMFVCTSVEGIDTLGAATYTFRTVKVLGISLPLLVILPLFIICIFLKKESSGYGFRGSAMTWYVRVLVLLAVSSAFFGLIGIALNDNNIAKIPGSPIQLLFGEFYTTSGNAIILAVIARSLCNRYGNHFIDLVRTTLEAIMCGVILQVIIAYLFGVASIRGGVQTLSHSLVAWYIPLYLIMGSADSYLMKTERAVWKLLGGVACLLMLMYNATGKLIITVMVSVFIVMIGDKRSKYFRLKIILCIPLILIGIPLVVDILAGISVENIMLQSKISQVRGLLDIFNSNWYSNMPGSPKFRIAELLNIFKEYADKPYWVLFGKGYLGTIKDYVGAFGNVFSNGSFSEQQWAIRSFYAMHESLNTLFLQNGLTGILVYFFLVKKLVKGIKLSEWAICALFWFAICYGYTVLLSTFGSLCMIISLNAIDNRKMIVQTK